MHLRHINIRRETTKEKAREFRRTVFTHDDWVAHRSTWRYFRHIKGLFASRIVRALVPPLLVVGLFAIFICCYETLRKDGAYIPSWWPALTLDDNEPFQMTAFAISLLLVFRTTESYTRWAEARKIWGGILNRSRDLARQTFLLMSAQHDEVRAAMLRWAIACPFSMKAHLRRVNDLAADLQDVLLPEELKALLAAEHRPNFTMSMMSELVYRAGLDPVQMLMIDQNLTFMADSIGSCERILKTPIPLSYTRHTSRFLIVFLVFLPLQLWDSCKWGAVPATLLISFLLLGIDEIGVMIEEPFSILALEAICETAKKNMLEIAERQTWARTFLEQELYYLSELSPKSRAWPRRLPVPLQPSAAWAPSSCDEPTSCSGSDDPEDDCQAGAQPCTPERSLHPELNDSVASFGRTRHNLRPLNIGRQALP
eukprot:jgi/Botrbrau1/2291/Bobra.101_2s0114.1